MIECITLTNVREYNRQSTA